MLISCSFTNGSSLIPECGVEFIHISFGLRSSYVYSTRNELSDLMYSLTILSTRNDFTYSLTILSTRNELSDSLTILNHDNVGLKIVGMTKPYVVEC